MPSPPPTSKTPPSSPSGCEYVLHTASPYIINAKLQADGKADKAAGKIQNAVGGVKDALRGK